MVDSCVSSRRVKSCGIAKLPRLGYLGPRAMSAARSRELLPEPFGPTSATNGSNSTSRLSSERKLRITSR